ncbi:MAG: glycosyltransferase family 2 protein [Pseudomonadota bacterium]
MGQFSDILKGKTPAQMRMSGAIWRWRLREELPSGESLVVFAIPLVSRARATDWDVVSANLARTIASLRAQTSDRWVAFVCGQDEPEGVEFDEQVGFVPYRGRAKFYDKGDKRVALIGHTLRRLAGRDGYYAQWDADDLLHPGAVAHVLGDNNGRGYLVETGIMADLSAGRFAWLAPPTPERETRVFWRVCGSCSFVRFDFRTQPRHWKKLLSRLSSHLRISAWMERFGLPLDPFPFPAAIYTFSHGENMSSRRGRTERRNAYIDAFPLSESEREAVAEAFNLAPDGRIRSSAERASEPAPSGTGDGAG